MSSPPVDPSASPPSQPSAERPAPDPGDVGRGAPGEVVAGESAEVVSVEPGSSSGSGLALAALFLAMAELGVAAMASTFAKLEVCPGTGSAACAALVRPRLGSLGPLNVPDLALAGAGLTCALALWLLLAPPRRRGWGTALAMVPAAGAGFAVGIQALPAMAAGAACPVCLTLAGTAFVTAAVLALAARAAAEARLAPVLAAFALTLAVTAPLAAWRGSAVREGDQVRRAAVAAVGGARGPEVLLVTRPGCPYCEALVLDVLADPNVLDLLGQTRGVREVTADDPAAKPHLDRRVAPVLLAIRPGEAGATRLLGQRLEGLRSPEEVHSWLLSALHAAGSLGPAPADSDAPR